MKKIICTLAITLLFQFLQPLCLSAQQGSNAKKILEKEYNLIPVHSKDTQYFEMESRLQKHTLDGTPNGLDIYHLYLRCVPSANPLKGDEYTCIKYTLQVNNAAAVSIPSLANWKYLFSLSSNAEENKGQVFSIDHSKFEQLKDENGKSLQVEKTYHVYNSFIDFHSMSVFSEKPATGKGIQDLKHADDKIIHSASFSQPFVSLGTQVAEGSYFKNGEITLSFKGLSLVNEKTCVLLEYDSGESSFYMLVKPMPNMEVPTKGSSHYWGDIYKDLNNGWIQKATLHELVISETSVPSPGNKINSVIERSINIKNVKQLN
jgi:hypothetical protein